jgi:hypothetical protein
MARKASVGNRASQFLSQIGTAGGPVGVLNSPNLVMFGAGDLSEQVLSANMDPYAAQRLGAQAPVIGSPANSRNPAANTATTMPSNLSAGYLHLNLPGSPLPMYGLMASHNARAAQSTQDSIIAMDQRMYTGAMPIAPQLAVDPSVYAPLGSAVAAAQQLSGTAARARGRR